MTTHRTASIRLAHRINTTRRNVSLIVIPAKAGTQARNARALAGRFRPHRHPGESWTPCCFRFRSPGKRSAPRRDATQSLLRRTRRSALHR